MRTVFIIIFIGFCSAGIQAQYTEEYRDSLRNTLASASQTKAKLEIYLELAKSHVYTDPDSTIFYTSLVQDLAFYNPGDDPSGLLAKAGYYKATALFYRGLYDQAGAELQQALRLVSNRDRFKKIEADLYRVSGTVAGVSGKYEISIDYFLRARRSYDELGLTSDEQSIRNNIGVTRLQLKDYEEALSIFEKLRQEQIESPRIKFSIPVNLAFAYYELGRLSDSEKMIEEAISLDPVNLSANPGLYFLIGELALHKNELDNAAEAYTQSYNGYESQGNEIQKVRPLLGLAKLSKINGERERSLVYSMQAKDIAESVGAYPELYNVYKYMYEYNRELKRVNEALIYLEKWKNISDSLNNAHINEQIGKYTTLYEFAEREKELINEQQRIQYESQLIMERQRIALYGFVSILFLAGGVIFMQRRNVDQRKRANEMLNKKKEEIQLQATKLNKTNSVKDHLFSIIAHDLRGPLSSLHGLLTLIEMNSGSKEELADVVTHVNTQFQHTSTLLTNLLNWSHTQMQGYVLSPCTFDLQPVCDHKFHLFKERLEEKKISFCYPREPMLLFADKDMMDVVLQNLISNAIKFCSTGDQIVISYTRDNEASLATINVSDTGTGMTQEAIDRIMSDEFFSTRGTYNEKGTGLGLMLCKDFISRNGGKLDIQSSPGSGSSFGFTLPVSGLPVP